MFLLVNIIGLFIFLGIGVIFLEIEEYTMEIYFILVILNLFLALYIFHGEEQGLKEQLTV